MTLAVGGLISLSSFNASSPSPSTAAGGSAGSYDGSSNALAAASSLSLAL
jgi:hypothetical protein|tara:strand:- start:60 stop:209 length:150 start_codon:yes stop_codon:yes gene_type:complete